MVGSVGVFVVTTGVGREVNFVVTSGVVDVTFGNSVVTFGGAGSVLLP